MSQDSQTPTPENQKPQQTARPVNNSGANDNPDEFSEFRRPDASPTENYEAISNQADPAEQRGHIERNQHPEAIADVQNASNSDIRAAYALDDPRYHGGGTSSTRDDDATEETPEKSE